VEITNFGGKEYFIEELTAEIGACYLTSLTGIGNHLKQSVSYIKGWLEALKNNKRLIVYASTQAQKATDYILNVAPIEKQ
jgi:antirestriction protein ArdC